MKIYEKIKREHLFIFIIVLIALILFSYFDFSYTGLTSSNQKSCTEQGYSCCTQGKGTSYFSLDNTCSQGQSCWSSCQVNKNLISGNSVFTDTLDKVTNFFKKIFKQSVGIQPTTPTDICTIPSCNPRNYNQYCKHDLFGNIYANCPSNAPICQNGQCQNIQGNLCSVPSCNPNNNLQYCFQSGQTSLYVDCPGGYSCFSGVCFSNTNPPGPVTIFTATPVLSSDKIDLSWQYTQTALITGFKIERSEFEFVNYQQIVNLVGPSRTSYQDTGRLQNTVYWYKIRAYNANGDSPYSNAVSATISYCSPNKCNPNNNREMCNAQGTGYTTCQSNYVCINDQCQIPPLELTCGNGQINTGEECDGSNLNAQTCITKGFTSGVLKCKADCTFDIGQCTGSLDTEKPQVTLISPSNNYIGNPNTPITFSCRGTDNIGLSKVEFWVTEPGKSSYIAEPRITSGLDKTESFTKSFSQASQSSYAWTCKFYDTSNNYAWGDINGLSAGFKIQATCTIGQCVDQNTICNNGVPQSCSLGQTCTNNVCSLNVQDVQKPNNLNAIVSPFQGKYAVQLYWDKPSSNNFDQYKIYRKSSTEIKNPLISASISNLALGTDYSKVYCGGSKCIYYDIGLNLNQVLNYNISAYDSTTNKQSDQTNNLMVEVKDNYYPQLKLLPIFIDNSNNKVSLRFTASDNWGINEIKIYVDDFNVAKKQCSLSGATFSTYEDCLYEDTLSTGQHGYKISVKDISNLVNESGVVQFFVGVKEDIATGNCNNGIDDDNDGAIDELDLGCASGAYVKLEAISPTYIGGGSINPTKQPWEDSDVNLRCVISQTGSTLDRAKNCIFAKVVDKSCVINDNNNDANIDFTCNVGSIGSKNISCNILKDCLAYPANNPIRHLNYTINVTKPFLCRNIIGQDKIEITNLNLDSSEYNIGDQIKSTLTLTNKQTDKDASISVSAQLYDINKRTLIKDANQTKVIRSNFDSQNYELNLNIPSVSDSKFKMYYKVYEQGKENLICLESKKDLVIHGSTRTSCQDLDNDGYADETCGGNDCNDNNPSINPGATEICTDNIDNDCNGLKDTQDSACQQPALCVSGTTRPCGKGICAGTQTCNNGDWGICSSTQQPITEICNNNLDDDCNGLTDSNDPSCKTGEEDSDNDGLPDSWEKQYFGDISKYSGEDDPDGDGFTNAQEYAKSTDPTDKNSHPEKPSLFKTVLIVIGVIIVAFILVWVFALRPKKPHFDYKPKIEQTSVKKPFFSKMETRVSPVLKDYVENSLRKGYTKEQIKKALLAKGWKESEIEQAFKK